MRYLFYGAGLLWIAFGSLGAYGLIQDVLSPERGFNVSKDLELILDPALTAFMFFVTPGLVLVALGRLFKR